MLIRIDHLCLLYFLMMISLVYYSSGLLLSRGLELELPVVPTEIHQCAERCLEVEKLSGAFAYAARCEWKDYKSGLRGRDDGVSGGGPREREKEEQVKEREEEAETERQEEEEEKEEKHREEEEEEEEEEEKEREEKHREEEEEEESEKQEKEREEKYRREEEEAREGDHKEDVEEKGEEGHGLQAE